MSFTLYPKSIFLVYKRLTFMILRCSHCSVFCHLKKIIEPTRLSFTGLVFQNLWLRVPKKVIFYSTVFFFSFFSAIHFDITWDVEKLYKQRKSSLFKFHFVQLKFIFKSGMNINELHRCVNELAWEVDDMPVVTVWRSCGLLL